MTRNPKVRLDQAVVGCGIAASRHRAKALVMAGQILVDGVRIDKPGTRIPADATLTLKGEPLPYVSRGGLKLEAALKAMALDVTGMDCLDVGASTGGFTDCLLQHGARSVVAVDVGYGQMAWRLRQDPRVVVVERTNFRHMPAGQIPAPVDLVTIDVSFISLKIIVPVALRFLKPDGTILALIKPQFEVGRENVGKGGVVRDPMHHRRIIDALGAFFSDLGLRSLAVIPSPVLGPKGNQEFVVGLTRRGTLPDDVLP